MLAQVYKIHSDFYYVKNSKEEFYTCKLKETLKKQKIDVCVGDYVDISVDNLTIIKLLDRANFVLRPKVSNIDLAVIVVSLKEPELDYIQLNRYLTFLKYHNIEAVICFNKEDLVEDLELVKQQIIAIYQKLNYKTFFISAKNKTDLDDFKNFIKNKTIVLMGLSGVGKSTLLNSLNPSFLARTNSVSDKLSRGRHTTRHCEIIEFDEYKIMDTPGFSCLKFDFILPNKLVELFDDLKIYTDKCKYSNCTHDVENKGVCGIVDNLDLIDKSRYESYLIFLEEAKQYKELISKRSIKNETFKKSVGNKVLTKISKRKRISSRKKDKQNLRGEVDE